MLGSTMDLPMIQQTPIQILIVDDHDRLREGVSTSLTIFPDLELIGEAANGIEAIQLCDELQPNVVLMDLMMPEMDGVEAIGKIHQQNPEMSIIVLASFGEDDLVEAALNAGASSFLLKNISAEELVEAIRATQDSQEEKES